MVEQLLGLIPCANVVYHERHGSHRVFVSAGPLEVPQAVLEAATAHGPQRPTSTSHVTAADGATRLSDRISRRDLVELDFFQTAMRPLGIEDELVLMLPSTAPRVAGFSFIKDGLFTDRDRQVLELLAPYLTAARERLGPSPLAARESLSRREQDVMTLVAQGKTNKEIAAILLVSPRTVHKHLENVFRKLGVHTRTAAVARVVRNDA